MENSYDLIIIGGGPAGLSAGIYGGRAKLRTLILEKGTPGGRAATTREIRNYPGLGDTTGPDLAMAMAQQAAALGAVLKKEQVKSADLTGEIKVIKTRKNTYTARAVILATGTKARVLGIPGEKELTGRGVAYCATCDAAFFEGQEVVVIGSGDQAIEESFFIAKFASHVTIVSVHAEGILDCNALSAAQAFENEKLSFVWNSTIAAVCGQDEVTGVLLRDLTTGKTTEHPCGGVFFFVGMVPCTEFLQNQMPLSRGGWITTSDKMETGLDGVFAVGDVRAKYLRQVSTAVSDGAVAATAAERYIRENMELTRLLETGKPVLLGFWTPELSGSLEQLSSLRQRAQADLPFIEIDVSRRKALAAHHNIALTQACPATVITINPSN